MSGKTCSEMSLFDAIQKRVSVRAYRADSIPPEHVEKILEAARQAPNAGNSQPWRFLVVQDGNRLREFRDHAWRARKRWLLENGYEADTDEGMKAHYDRLLGAPLQIVILIDKEDNYRGYAEEDGSLAAENIMLAARALGYGSVMITGSVSRDTVREFFKVPARYAINSLIPIGVPESWPEKKLRRPLTELIFRERIPRRPRGE